MINKSKAHYAYVIVFCCCLIMGVNIGLVMSCAGIFYGPVSTELGVSVGSFGLYMTFIYGFSFLMLSIAGKLMDKYSARWLLTICSGLIGVTYLAMSKFTAVWQYYFAGSIIGVSLAFLLYLSYPVLMNRWFNERVGFFIGVCSAASGIGGVVFNPIAGLLIEHYGWRNTYLIFGFTILLIVTPLLGLLLRDFPSDKGLNPVGGDKDTGEVLKKGMDYASAIKTPSFYGLIIFAFLMIAVSTLNLFLPTYVIGMGFSVEQSALVASAIMLGATIGKIALGYLNDKNPMIGVVSSVGMGIVGLIFLLLGKNGIIVLGLGGFFFGWAYAGVTVETALLVRKVFGTKDYSKIFSNISIALASGGALMAGGWGYLLELWDFKIILSLGIGFLAIAGTIGLYSIKNSRTFNN